MAKEKYDYNSRSKYAKKVYDEWEKKVSSKFDQLSDEGKSIITKIGMAGRSTYTGFDKGKVLLDKYLKGLSDRKNAKMSDFIRQELGYAADIYVSEKFQKDYYSIVDEFVTFQYSSGWDRRSVRSDDLNLHLLHAVRLMYTYMSFETYKVSVADFIRDRLPEEVLDFKRQNEGCSWNISMLCLDDIYAARINAGDTDTIEAIKEAFLSENNNVIITAPMIRAVVKCKNTELHDLLAKLLVAARLSEGLRQIICESADCGRADCFLKIIDTIKNENMIRFAAVKRAVSTWSGLGDAENTDRIIGKVFDEMCRALNDTEYAKDLVQTDDTVKITVGLWSLGFYGIDKAAETALEISKNGSRSQLLAVSYFNRSVQNERLERIVSHYVMTSFSDDQELVAAFMPTYMSGCEAAVRMTFKTRNNESSYRNPDADYIYSGIDLNDFFENEEEARNHYSILKKIADSMKKRKTEFSPCIFPWYKAVLTKGDLVIRMAVIAYALSDDELIDDVCTRISEVDGNYSERSDVLRMLLHDPHTEVQKNALLDCLADKADYSRTNAYYIVNKMDLDDNDYRKIESFLKYKAEDIRKNVISLLRKQDAGKLAETAGRLVSDNNGSVRLAGFDIIKTSIENDPSVKNAYQAILKDTEEESLSEQEKILYREIMKNDDETENSTENGYGLFDDSAKVVLPELKADMKKIRDYFNVPKKKLDEIFNALEDLLKENAQKEYVKCSGETAVLGNGLYLTNYDYKLPAHERYPFPELWNDFYDKYIGNEQVLWNLYLAQCSGYSEDDTENYSDYISAEREIFPYCGSDYSFKGKYTGQSGRYFRGDIKTVLTILISAKNSVFPRNIARECCIYAAGLSESRRWYKEKIKTSTSAYMFRREPALRFFVKTEKFRIISHAVQMWNDDEEFRDSFIILRMLDEAYMFQEKTVLYAYNRPCQENYLSVLMFIKACECGLIGEDMVYRYIFTGLPVSVSAEQLSVFSVKKFNLRDIQSLKWYIKCDEEKYTCDENSAYFILGKRICEKITELILSVELKRGDSETIFSAASLRLSAVYGIDTLFDILTAFGRDKFDRNTYYYYSQQNGRKECLSHLLQICFPDEGDSAEKFAKKVKEKKITEERIIEVAMYAPQWLDIIEEYLKCEGFRSSCYYFMAHMNERFDERRKSMIAKYTPLSEEELNDGAFDFSWFKEAYSQLGDSMFQKLYKAAKYISDGSKHSRARKYADAALGLVERDELEVTISDKRNKDLLMSYGIIPLKGEEDQLHRYEFIQKFLKESKQFGGQRRASESKACDMALKNMATVAGYADSLRLILAMETALVLSNQKYFDGIEVGDYLFTVEVSGGGKAEIKIRKDGKNIKSVPAALKKDETVLEIKEFAAKLKDQYSRSVRMFENAMEEREVYTKGELFKLLANPVIGSILNSLVFITDENRLSLLSELSDQADDKKVRVAHPYDLYQSGEWNRWQKLFFEKADQDNIKQPFRQVFRELYVKLPEENEQFDSRMFAGNQIQPKKTLAVLKSRRWLADYENGLQKIYYKDNIIATIYAMADWFSPADTEEPTLEYVSFYDRKTFKQLKIKDIPDVVYSEVMRDVDLAVSVAHAGSVDPETSHSTIEMRAVIAEFNIQLFGLENVKISGTHAFVEGKYGNYSIHLGSGVIHKTGSHMINILPVHSQNRGRIFLPFIDDDPKTAEIISKIVLLAEDNKIKDPLIMEQIVK